MQKILLGILASFFTYLLIAQAPTYEKNTGATGNNTFAFGGGGSSKRVQMLYLPSDFVPSSPSGLISTLYFMYGSTGIIANTDYVNIQINLGQTTNTTFSPATTFYTGLTPVFTKSTYTIPAGTSGTWFSIPLDNPFLYDNTKTLIVEIFFDSYTNTNNSTGIGTFTGTAVAGRKLYTFSLSATTGTATSNLQNVGFDLNLSPCTTPPTPGTAQVNTAAVCPGGAVQLNLTGNTIGSGQTYVWQRAATSNGTYTNVSSSATTSFFNTNPTSTGYYRAAVTCSGTTTYSAPVLVTVNSAFPGGTYTINSNVATGGTNFQTFAAAANAVKCGIAGPIVFNVAAGSGPYNEQVTIDSITGTSVTNTITINGNGATLQFAPTVNDRHFIRLNGADYVTINNLNITAAAGAIYGWGVHLTNGANNNTINNCNIDLSTVTSTVQSNSGGIVMSGSPTIVTTDGSASENTITNNTIIGGYQGIIITGTTGGLGAVRNTVRNNSIQDFYADGIQLTENNNAVITSNDINRRNRAAVTTFSGIELGAGNRNVVVSNNRIHDTHTSATTQTGTAYGIYATACDADSGAENKVFNNLIYNFNSGSGPIYGLYNSSSNGIYYYHNTLVLDNAASTAGVTRGVYQTGAATNIQIKNNNIYITRGGSGIKYALYFGTAPSSAGGIISNNNNLYNVAPAGTNGIGYYLTAGYATLTEWKAANSSAFDQQSVSADPIFTGTPVNYVPTNTAIDTVGALVGVPTDILNVTRSNVKPDVGAYEFGTNPLPVKLVDFSVFTSKADAIINWATATELNTHHFIIERSLDGSSFTGIQTIVAKGNSTSLTTYTATDYGVWNTGGIAKVYYRLKVVDRDGKYSYSRTVVLSNKPSTEVVQVFPNPVENDLYVKLVVTSATKATITLTDVAGRKLSNSSQTLSAGSNIISVPGIARLSRGAYKVQVLTGSRQYNFSIVK